MTSVVGKRGSLQEENKLAFVLGGGGARGALQVGALRALLEEDLQPDLLVGTSIGAVNAAFIALNGLNPTSISALEETWHEAAQEDLLPSNYLWLTVRALFRRPSPHAADRLRGFFLGHGLSPDLRFRDLDVPELLLVSTDLDHGELVVYGRDPNQSVLEGLLASTALPPWMQPVEQEERTLVDGGVVSTLPIEPALNAGAREIIALDLLDSRSIIVDGQAFGSFISKVINAVEQRQAYLESALAKAHGVPLTHVKLHGPSPIALWDFQHTEDLFQTGYEITRKALEERRERLKTLLPDGTMLADSEQSAKTRRSLTTLLRRLITPNRPGDIP